MLSQIRKELKANSEKAYKDGAQNYFKEEVKFYGVRTPIVRVIAKKYFGEIRHLPKKQIFALCDELLKNKYGEEATVAIQWASVSRKNFEKSDFLIFESWLKKYLDNWGKIDDFSIHVIHPIIDKYPELIPKVKLWAKSKNMWVRRASAVSFIVSTGFGTKQDLNDIFDVANVLLQDKEDLVQKGYGWMLKEASVHHQKQVFDFVMKNNSKMPRTALRYAIEKMPDSLKKKAMRKD